MPTPIEANRLERSFRDKDYTLYFSRDRGRTLLNLWPQGEFLFRSLSRETADGSLVATRGIPTPYPVSALALIGPLSLLP